MCSGAIDSWKHALINCHMSKCVCALVDEQLPEYMIACRVDDERLQLATLQDSMNEKQFAKMLVTLWAIWQAHRKAKQGQISQSPLSTMAFVNKYLDDLDLIPPRKQTCIMVTRSVEESG